MVNKLVRDKVGEERSLNRLSPKGFKELLLKEIEEYLNKAITNIDGRRYSHIAEAQERFQMLVTAIVPKGKHTTGYEQIMMAGRLQALDGGFFEKFYEDVKTKEDFINESV